VSVMFRKQELAEEVFWYFARERGCRGGGDLIAVGVVEALVHEG